MVNAAQLQALGLTARETQNGPGGAEAGLEADLALEHVALVNPLTRSPITTVTFTAVEERLIPIAPPELVGTPPIVLAGIEDIDELESIVAAGFNDHMAHVQRRSAQLQALGVSPRVDPRTLELSADVDALGFQFKLVADRRGNFRVASATRDGKPVEPPASTSFELSEFRELPSLAGYLAAMFGSEAPAQAAAPAGPGPIRFSEIAEIFAPNAVIPAASPVELLVEMRVNGALYRFAAARVAGRTFRGLLAGKNGKLWAERFTLEEFPGVKALVADLLEVPQEQIELLGGGDEG